MYFYKGNNGVRVRKEGKWKDKEGIGEETRPGKEENDQRQTIEDKIM